MMRGALLETSARTILNQGINQSQKETALRAWKSDNLGEIAEDTGLSVTEVELLAGIHTV